MSGVDLIERLQAAEAGDRELDCEIAILIDGFFTMPPRYEGDDVRYCYRDADGGEVHPGQGGDMLVRRYTTSLDAALALAESLGLDVLSVTNEAVEGLAVGGWFASAKSLVPDLARHACIAILKATTATQTGDNGHVG